MADLTIKGIPDDVHRTLIERAKVNQRSFNQEVIVGLAAHVRRTAVADLLRRIDLLRKRIGGPLLSEREIRAARRTGRRWSARTPS